MKDTQTERVLRYMKQHGEITPLDALRELGCMHLASRITDLRQAGYEIKKEIRAGKRSSGEAVRFAVYRLGGERHGFD